MDFNDMFKAMDAHAARQDQEPEDAPKEAAPHGASAPSPHDAGAKPPSDAPPAPDAVASGDIDQHPSPDQNAGGAGLPVPATSKQLGPTFEAPGPHADGQDFTSGPSAGGFQLPADPMSPGPEAFWREGGVPPYDTLMIGWARKQPEWETIDGEVIDVDFTTVETNAYHRVFDDLSQLGEADHELAAAMREDLDQAATAEGQRIFDQKAAMYASALNAGAPGPAPSGMGGGGFSLGGWGRPRPPAPPRHAPSALTLAGRAVSDKLHAYRRSRTVDAFQQVDDAGETVQKTLDRLRNSPVGSFLEDGKLNTDQGRKAFTEALAGNPDAKALFEKLSDDVGQFADNIQKASLAATRAGYDPAKVQDLLKQAANPILSQVKDIPDAKDPKGDKTLGDSVKAAIKAIKVILAALTRRNPSSAHDHDLEDDGPRLTM